MRVLSSKLWWKIHILDPAKKSLTLENFIRFLPVIILLVAVVSSFIHGWYFDHSVPQSGRGWADQNLYLGASERLAEGDLPTATQLHFSVGYPLLGAIGGLLYRADPFMLVSLLLLVASTLFCYFAVRKLYGQYWAMLFSFLLLWWDGYARSLHTASEIFVIPWNNQVLYFSFAFFFSFEAIEKFILDFFCLRTELSLHEIKQSRKTFFEQKIKP